MRDVNFRDRFKPTTSVWMRLAFLVGTAIVIVAVVIALSDFQPHPLVAGLLAVAGMALYGFTIYRLVVENRGTVGDRPRAMRDGLPDSQFITWQSADGESHVATRVTIDGEQKWRHDGETLEPAELLALTAGAPVRQL